MKFLLIAALILSVQLVNAEDHHHQSSSEHAKNSKVQDLGSKKFVPTADLKVRMEKILNLMKELRDKKSDAKAVREYGDKVSDTVKDIFKTCKLEPAADAAIHPVLAKVLRGTKELKNGHYDAGHKEIHESLLDYEKLFSHKDLNH